MLKFLQRAPKSFPPGETSAATGDTDEPAPVSTVASGTVDPQPAPAEQTAAAGPEPKSGMFGMDRAREVLRFAGRSKPRTMVFVAAPRTSGHIACLHALLAEEARGLPVCDAIAAVANFDDPHTLSILRLPMAQAKALAGCVADAVEMLSVTLPAAFASDSYTIARLALDEELRSGHDSAIDALKRRASSSNIGLLRTPLGYAVAPMHEGRVVAPDVFKALPDGLKADVEAKLTAFETELSGVLENRSVLQQDYRSRLRELDHEVAGLAVRASLSGFAAKFSGNAPVTAYLEALSRDLTRNAALFLAADRKSQGQARAPVEIAEDAALARYRVQVLGPARATPGLEIADSLERGDIFGTSRTLAPGRAPNPADICPGAITRAGGGFLVIDARDLLAQYSSWLLLKQAFKSGVAIPADGAGATGRAVGASLPVDARLVITGDFTDYQALCTIDGDIARNVPLITAFDDAVALTPAVEREFAGLVAGLIRDEGLQPLDNAGLAAVMGDQTSSRPGAPMLSTDLDVVRDVLTRATLAAKSHGRAVTTAADILSAMKERAQTEALLQPTHDTNATQRAASR